jgi:very-short-patch-repair endonuclease
MPTRTTSLARGMRRRQTTAEVRLWSRLRNRRLENLKFRRQVPRGSYIADFLCDEAMLIVEVDGGQHAERTVENERRTAYLESLGYLVMRLWNFDVLQNTDRVCDHIRHVASSCKKPFPCGACTPSPQELSDE